MRASPHRVSSRFPALAIAVLFFVATAGSAAHAVADKAHAHIYVIASKSFCLASGISDLYTGMGRVSFWITLRNSGAVAGEVSITPVRHYDDGEFNQSILDTLIDVEVPARSTRRFRSPPYKYKAHEHEVESCGLIIDSRKEVPIRARYA